MAHECDACGQTFGTLSRLRLHDCPGPDLDDGGRGAFVDQLAEGLERGTVLTTLPDGGLEPADVDRLREHDRFVEIIVPMNNPGERTTERLAVLIEDHAYVIEYFPRDGWVVTRGASTEGMTEEEATDTLLEQLQDWQSTVTELSVEYAGGEDVSEKLRRELNR
jgi:hypothetical protein